MSARRGGLGRGRSAHRPAPATLLKFLAFVTVTGLLTLFVGQRILGTSLAARYRLTATFDDVSGLQEGDAVKIAGAPVGRVSGIRIEQGKAVVGLRIDEDVRVPEDSTAAIRWRDVMGRRVVYLEPGRARGRLGDGARVPHTRSVVDLGDVVNGLGPLTRNLDPVQINRILFALSQALDGNERNVGLLADELDALLETFAARRRTLRTMIGDYATVSGAIAARDRQISASIGNLESLTKVFAAHHELLENAVVEISGATADLNAVLDGNDARLTRIIGNLGRIGETFRLNVDQLERMVRNLPLTLRQLFAAANGGHYLRADVLCLNIVQGPCPFPMRLPRAPGGRRPDEADLARLKAMLGGGRWR